MPAVFIHSGKVGHEPYAFALSWLPCQDPSNKSGALGDANFSLVIMVRAAPKGHEQVQFDFRSKKSATKLVPPFSEEGHRAITNRSVSASLRQACLWN